MAAGKIALNATDRPYRAPIDKSAERRGLAVGVAAGIVAWVVLGIAVWRVLL